MCVLHQVQHLASPVQRTPSLMKQRKIFRGRISSHCIPGRSWCIRSAAWGARRGRPACTHRICQQATCDSDCGAGSCVNWWREHRSPHIWHL